VETAEGQKADWMNWKHKGASGVLESSTDYGIPSCEKVSRLNGHSSNIYALLSGQRFHSGTLCMFIVKRFDDITSTITQIL